ncbi:hypothetical protein QYF36_001156 [Acer negundo]|nr:hypothetical protein QYF36_001156 [Acer negundo]
MDTSRKWLRQENATYVIVNFMRIPKNETAFWVYEWMKRQDWYRFDFALATKVANSLESVLDEFVKSGMKPPMIMPSYINLTNLDLGMRDRLHLAFS